MKIRCPTSPSWRHTDGTWNTDKWDTEQNPVTPHRKNHEERYSGHRSIHPTPGGSGHLERACLAEWSDGAPADRYPAEGGYTPGHRREAAGDPRVARGADDGDGAGSGRSYQQQSEARSGEEVECVVADTCIGGVA